MGCSDSRLTNILNLPDDEFNLYLQASPIDLICQVHEATMAKTLLYATIASKRALTTAETDKMHYCANRLRIVRANFSKKYDALDNIQKRKYEFMLDAFSLVTFGNSTRERADATATTPMINGVQESIQILPTNVREEISSAIRPQLR